jgi:H+-transporting ATPase
MVGGAGPRSARRKTKSDVSDMMALAHLPRDAVQQRNRRRQKSSTDVITKFNQATILRFDDLKLADHVAVYGSRRERLESGLSDKDLQDILEAKEENEIGFTFNEKGLSSDEAAALLEKYGRNELPEKIDPKWLIFLRQFWAPMPIMIWVAIIIEIGISNYLDMAILLVIQFANASISFYETNKAGNAIAALKSSLKPLATCKRDGKWQVIDAALLVPGDTVLLGSGSAIPADCRVNHSEIDVDQAALTGESLPVTFYKGDSCKMGSTVVRGEVEVRTQKSITECCS